MAVGSSAAELKVLISFLQDGNGLKTILGDVKDLASKFAGVDGAKLKEAGKHAEDIIPPIKHANEELGKFDEFLHKIGEGLKLVAGGFLAFESVRLLKEFADTAARAEVLSTVLHVVGNNAGYSREELDKTDASVQRLGITAAASRQSLAQFVQAGFELSRATELARVAQDAAVILGVNSSEAFQRLTTAAQTRNTLILRSMGIIVSADTAEQRYAQSIGKTTTQLTIQEKSFAFLDAEIREGQKISGAYTEAMNDVGKQLTSLDRLTDNLKESMGKNLLPAYLAIVEEFSLFLEQSRLVTDEYGNQGAGAERLGEAVRFIASSLREIALFIEKHIELIGAAATAWALFRYAIVPVSRIIAALAAGEGFGALGAGIGAVVGLLGPFGAAIAAVVVGLTAWLAQSETGRRELGLFFAQIQAGLGGAIGLFHTFVATFQTVFKSLTAYIEHPFNPDAFQAPWKEWANYVKSQMEEVRDYWRYTKKEFVRILDGDKIDKKEGISPNLQAELDRTRDKLADAQKNVLDAKRQVERTKNSNDTEEIKSANNNLTAMKNAENDLVVKWSNLIEGPGMTQAHRDIEEKRLVDARRQRDVRNLVDERDQARALTPGFNYDAQGAESSKAFDLQLGALNSRLKLYQANVKDAKVDTDELSRGYVEAGKAAKTAGDLKALTLAVEGLKQAAKDHPDPKDAIYIPPSVLQKAKQAVETATIEHEKFVISQTAEIDTRRKALFDVSEAATAEHIRHQLDILKLSNQEQEDLDKEAFDKGLLSLNDYYDARRDRILSQNAGELAVAKQALQALEDERRKGLIKSVEADAQSRQKIQEAKDTIEKTERQGVVAVVGNEQARIKGSTALNDQITALKNEYDAYYGGLNEALTQVREKWRKKAIELKVLDTAEVIVQGLALDTEKAILEFKNRQKQVTDLQEQADAYYGGLDSVIKGIHNKAQNLRTNARENQTPGISEAIDRLETLQITKARQDDANKGLQVELGVKQGLLSLDRALLETAKDNNDITTNEYKARSNALIEEEIQIKETEITAKEKELALNKEILAQAQERNALNPAGKQEDLHGLERDIETVEGQIYKLDGEVVTLTTRIDTYGKQLRKVFTESLSTAISESLQNVRNAGKSFIELGNALRKNIADAFAATISEKITKYIVDTTSKKDDAGKLIPNSSIFDTIFKKLGLSKEVKNDGSTQSRFLWTKDVDRAEKEGKGPGGQPNVSAGKPNWDTYGDKWWYDKNGNPTGGTGGGDLLSGGLGKLANLGESALSPGIVDTINHTRQIIGIVAKAFSGVGGFGGFGGFGFAGGGLLDGPGNGTSDSIPIMASRGEFITPADKTQKYLPLLEAMRSGRLTHFALGGVVDGLQSIALPRVITPRYAAGGMVQVTDAGASAVTPAGGGAGNMTIQLHPDAMNMSLRDWLEQEVVRQHGRR